MRICEWKKSLELKSIVQKNRTTHSQVNSTEVRCRVMLGIIEEGGNKQNGCPEMTNEQASKHTQ